MQAVLEWIKNYFINVFSSPAQIVGFVALVVAVSSFQQRERKGLLFMQSFSTMLFCIHMLMLKGYSGSALNFLSAVRSVVYYNKDKKWASSIWWPVGFMIAFTAVTAAIMIFIPSDFPRWYNIFPLIGAYVYTIATYIDSAKVVRRTIWLSSVVWIIYGIAVGSIAGVVAESISLVSDAIAILRFDILGKKRKTHNKWGM